MSRLRPPVHEGDHIAGDPSAPVVLVEYGDYECPFCGRAHGVVEALQQTLAERLCFVFRHFPLATVHPHAALAAEAAEAAGAQGRFWQMHNLLYENQTALEPADLIGYASMMQLDVDAFVDDLRTHRFLEKVRADLHSGALSGVNGTPTFFINGLRHDGAWDFDSLFGAITGAAAPEMHERG
ncbi:MAG: bdbD [Myxococcales bacterium]|nr:bdbD [Myxococcales bacterium]